MPNPSTTPHERPARPITPETLERLRDLVGPAGVIDAPDEVAAYCKPWRGTYFGRSPLVLRPASTEEMAAVVGLCAAERVPIVPQGGRTGMTGGSQPHDDMSEVVVSTERMRRVRAIDLENDTLTVEAGVVLAEIQRLAAEHDRLFPLSLGAEGSCQIGGNISTNAGGVQVLRYGNTRNLVLGLEVVLPDGRVWDGLRGLRKDNTGYDLKQLFIGAEGTLGIVTAAVLRLLPRPKESQTAFIGLASPKDSVALLALVRRHFADQIAAFELIDRGILELAFAALPVHTDPLATRHPWYVLTEVTGQGAPGSLAEPMQAALAEAMEAGLVADAILTTSSEQAKRLWRLREELPQAQLAAGGSVAHDISVPLSRIPEFIARADAAVRTVYPGARPCCFGHVGDGNLHYNPVRPLEVEPADWQREREAINKLVHDVVVDLGGSISAEHGVGRLRLAENERYKSAVELDLLRTVKRALDPLGIMNPGKVVR
jgi:FAD/FMN-containing dehydrogenase